MPDDNQGRPAGPVVLRIKLRYDDLDTMVERFAVNVGKSGLFLPTRSVQPIGSEVKFELRLANDTALMVGLGRVKHVKEPDPDHPRAPFGMSIELMRVSREGREVIMKMLAQRRATGLPEVAIPIPDREVESQPRADTAAIVRDSMAQLAAAQESDRVLTPRRISDVPTLQPEPVRQRRPRISELIERAGSAPLVAGPELGDGVDVERALARARALATGDLDVELASLRESAAAPLEISVDAASVELARQLGGKPIAKRDRSAKWAPPPAVEVTPLIHEVQAVPVMPAFDPDEIAVAEASIEESMDIEPPAVTAPPVRLQAPSLVPAESYVIRKSDRFDAPYSDDYQEQGYSAPADPDYDLDQETPFPTGDEDLMPPPAPMLAPVAPVAAKPAPIEEDPDLAAFEAALDAARIHTGVTVAAPPADDEEDEADDLADITGLSTPYVADDFAEMRPIDPYAGTAAYQAPEGSDDEEEEIEELDDMDLVEIEDDEDDAAAAPPVVSTPVAHAPTAAMNAIEDDFASRLDLGDDAEPPERDSYDERPAGFGARRYERSPRELPEMTSDSFTLAENLPAPSLAFREQDGGESFDEPHAYAREPRMLQRAPAEDLEQALKALDVDIDPAHPAQRPRRAQRPLPGLPLHKEPTQPNPVVKKRAPTDDGIMIDFDDED